MFKSFCSGAWALLKTIRWGWGALFAIYGFVTYTHLFKFFGSAFLGAVAAYLALLAIAKLMNR